MRGQQERTGPLFSYISSEDRIPASHPLRQVRRLADQALDRLKPTFCRLYPEGGRPSIPPEQLLLALLLQAIYGIRSERMLIEQLDYCPTTIWLRGRAKQVDRSGGVQLNPVAMHRAQGHRRSRARPPQEPRPVPRVEARGPNQVWSWDITYLPIGVHGVCLYLYLEIDVWSRKAVAWDVADREEAQTAADLDSRACLRERISKGRPRPLILHADNSNAMRAATLESRLEELGVLRSFSRPRVSNDNPYSESLFRTVKYRPNYPRRPFASTEKACTWVAMFVDWYYHQHRHSGIRFVTPSQRHSREATAISRHRAHVYEQARLRHPRRWSRKTRCWRQPEVIWINPPPIESDAPAATLMMGA